MLKEILEGRLNFIEKAASWEDAISIAAQPLLCQDYITQQYIDAMIKNVEVNGSYIVIMPGFAMPHSKPSDGVKKTGMSLLKLEEPVTFPEEQEVKLLVVLASNNSDIHLDLLSELTEVLLDDDKKNRLFESKTDQDVMEIL